jgi:hypothetical protein
MSHWHYTHLAHKTHTVTPNLEINCSESLTFVGRCSVLFVPAHIPASFFFGDQRALLLFECLMLSPHLFHFLLLFPGGSVSPLFHVPRCKQKAFCFGMSSCKVPTPCCMWSLLGKFSACSTCGSIFGAVGWGCFAHSIASYHRAFRSVDKRQQYLFFAECFFWLVPWLLCYAVEVFFMSVSKLFLFCFCLCPVGSPLPL